MTQAFTSYSRRDTETVDRIVAKMAEAGISVWIDRADIQAGDTWRVQIVRAIRTSPAFVLMLSPSSAESDNVRKEIDLSQGYERTLFPVMLQKVRPLPDEISYQLAGEQIIDVEKLGVDHAVTQLIETLKDYLRKVEQVEEPATQQVELVIQGIDLKALTPEKQQQLLDFMANLTSADRSQLQIAKITAGSVHVFVDMPTSSAYEVLTMALNRDPRFKELGIVSLRLDGDTKYVNVSTGKLTPAATVSSLAALWLKIPALFAPMLGVSAGKVLTVLLITGVIAAGAGIFASKAFTPAPTATQTSSPASPVPSTSTQSASDTAVPTATQTSSPTSTITETPIATQSPTLTPTPTPSYLTLTGVIANPLSGLVACRYGPGDIYLYRFGPRNGIKMDVSGKAETRTLRETQTWLWGLIEDY